jgi:hypothetical protein
MCYRGAIDDFIIKIQIKGNLLIILWGNSEQRQQVYNVS